MPDYTAIFTRIGAFARIHRQCRLIESAALSMSDDGVTLRTPLDMAARIRDVFDANDETSSLAAIQHLTRLGSSARATWQSIKPICDAWLAGPLATSLAAPSDATATLAALSRAMLDDDEAIQASDVSLSPPVADPANTGDGIAIATLGTMLPGAAEATPSQRAREQTIELLCISDSASDGTAPGREAWLVRSASGATATAETIPVTNASTEDPRNLVLDGSFTAFEGGAFDAFTATGAALFDQSTSDSRFEGTALHIESDADGIATLTQVLSEREQAIPGGRLLALGAYIKAPSLTIGNVAIRVTVNGTPCDGAIVIASDNAESAWTHFSAWVTMPRIARNDIVSLEIVASADLVGELLIDGLSLAAPDQGPDGISVAIFQGVRAFSRSPFPDRFQIASESDDAGAFATFLRDVYATELPSSDTPTISDALAI